MFERTLLCVMQNKQNKTKQNKKDSHETRCEGRTKDITKEIQINRSTVSSNLLLAGSPDDTGFSKQEAFGLVHTIE
jgi:hypothetical protein